MAQRTKRAHRIGSVTNSCVFVWLAFLCSPAAAAALTRLPCENNGTYKWIESVRRGPIDPVIRDLNPRDEMRLIDIDGDSDLDLVTRGFATSQELQVWSNDGGAGFTPGTVVPLRARDRPGVLFGDFDGVPNTDMVVINYDPTTVRTAARIYFGTAQGFEERQTLTLPVVPDGTAVADIDGDGDQDAAVAGKYFDRSGSGIVVLRNDGNGYLSLAEGPLVGGQVYGLAAEAIDSAPGIDLAVTTDQNALMLFSNLGDGTFGTPHTVRLGATPSHLAIGNFDGNEIPDAFVGTRLVLNPGSAEPVVQEVPDDLSGAIVADANGDGHADFLSVPLSVHTNRGDASFEAVVHYDVGNQMRIVVGDLDGDGRPDAVLSDRLTQRIRIAFGRDDGHFGAAIEERFDGLGPVALLERADVDGDGWDDLILTDDSGTLFVAYVEGDEGLIVRKLADSFQASSALADFDGDGDLDFVYSGGLKRSREILKQGPPRHFITESLGVTVNGPLATHDIDGDGDPDLLGTNGSGNSWSIEIISNLNGTLSNTSSYPLPFQRSLVSWADADGDGDPDAISQGIIVPNLGDGTFGEPLVLPGVTTAPMAGDFNADGLQDLAAYDDAAARFVLFLRLPDHSFVRADLARGRAGFGLPFSADIDGDTDVDLVYGENLWVNTRLGGLIGPVPNALTGPPIVIDIDGDHRDELVAPKGSALAIYELTDEPEVGHHDCDRNGTIDSCEVDANDCNGDNLLDACQLDADDDDIADVCDRCPGQNDNADRDRDGVGDCLDGCPSDAHKSTPGVCGCGISDRDMDSDGVPDCVDACLSTPDTGQVDSDGDGFGDACDACPLDLYKTKPAACGCEREDVDSDFDGAADCLDACPFDRLRHRLTRCPCGSPVEDLSDRDSDKIESCNDNCPSVANAEQSDGDADGIGDACDRVAGTNCFADCDSNGVLDSDEVADGVSPLFSRPAQDCSLRDLDGDGRVRASELVATLIERRSCPANRPHVVTHESQLWSTSPSDQLALCGHPDGTAILVSRQRLLSELKIVARHVSEAGRVMIDPLPLLAVSFGSQLAGIVCDRPEGGMTVTWIENDTIYEQHFGRTGRPASARTDLGGIDSSSFPAWGKIAVASAFRASLTAWPKSGPNGMEIAGQWTSGDGARFDRLSFGRVKGAIGELAVAAAVAATGDRFAVVRYDDGIVLGLYDGDAMPIGSQQLMSDSRFSPASGAMAVAFDSRHRGLVAWTDETQSGSETYLGVQGRSFSSDGTPSSESFRIMAASPMSPPRSPRVVGAGDGRFLVTWEIRGTSSARSPSRLFGRLYDINGHALGPEVQLSLGTSAEQAELLPLSDARAFAAWQSGSLPFTSHLAAATFDLTGRVAAPIPRPR